ncbi:MAG: LacI family DNA-binding transcriptional regulator [Anaerolineae bacterium]|nr:LacI family DNA-binding transcriptional regulator [Anaerolineae bacterium]
MATIKDVAKVAGVSTATVSYVLNNSFPVSETTRQRVLEAARKLGYRPSIIARNLRANESRLIGYAWHGTVDSETNPVLDQFIHHLASNAEQHGYHILTFTHTPENALKVYTDLIETGHVDAFVIAETNVNDVRIDFLRDIDFPFVAFGRANPGWNFPYVDVDGKKGVYEATKHLVTLGHQRIAFIGWPEGSMAGDNRYAGYCTALQDAGLSFNPDLVKRGEHRTATGNRAAHALLGMPTGVRPTAIAAVSDLMAIGAMSAIEQLGMRAGRDVAVVGFDNVPLTEHLQPPLTSLRQPIDQVARKLIEMLIAVLKNEPLAERQVLIAPELIVRASSGAPR